MDGWMDGWMHGCMGVKPDLRDCLRQSKNYVSDQDTNVLLYMLVKNSVNGDCTTILK